MINTIEQCVDAWSGIDWTSTQQQLQANIHSFSDSSQQILQTRKALIEQSRGENLTVWYSVEAKASKSEEALLELVKTLQKTVDDMIYRCKEREECVSTLAAMVLHTPDPLQILKDWQVHSCVCVDLL